MCEWLEAPFFDGCDHQSGKVFVFAHRASVHDKLAVFFGKELGSEGDVWIQIKGYISMAERAGQLDRFKT